MTTWEYIYALKWILTGDMAGKALEEFKAGCLNMVAKIRETPYFR